MDSTRSIASKLQLTNVSKRYQAGMWRFTGMEEACTAAAGSASRNPTCKRPDVKDLMQHCRAVCNALTFKVFMQGPSVHMVMLALCRCHSSYSRLSGIFTHTVCTVTSNIPGQLDHGYCHNSHTILQLLGSCHMHPAGCATMKHRTDIQGADDGCNAGASSMQEWTHHLHDTRVHAVKSPRQHTGNP